MERDRVSSIVIKFSEDQDTGFEILESKVIKTSEGEDDIVDGDISQYHANIMKQITEFLNSKGPCTKVGIASFGPICIDPDSEHYGSIMNTPKKKWVMFNLIEGILRHWPGPEPTIKMDTDVNAVAKFEFDQGGHKATKNLAYITVGTGIGVGLVINGNTVTGLTHPEGGHV